MLRATTVPIAPMDELDNLWYSEVLKSYKSRKERLQALMNFSAKRIRGQVFLAMSDALGS